MSAKSTGFLPGTRPDVGGKGRTVDGDIDPLMRFVSNYLYAPGSVCRKCHSLESKGRQQAAGDPTYS
jgi:hypothetical protein